MISQPADPTTYQPQPLWSRKWLIAMVTLFVLILGWFLGQSVIQQIGKFATDTWHCMTTECNPKGPSATWQELFSSADGAVRKIDSDAILTSVSAVPAAYNFTAWHDNDALEVTFNYMLPDGTDLHIHLLDTLPSAVTIPGYGTDKYAYSDRILYREATQHKDAIESALARVVLTPRQAIEATLTQVRAMEQTSGKEVRPSVYFYPFSLVEGTVMDQYWYTNYSLLTNGKYADSNVLLRPLFTVDTATGAVENITKTEGSLTTKP